MKSIASNWARNHSCWLEENAIDSGGWSIDDQEFHVRKLTTVPSSPILRLELCFVEKVRKKKE